MPMNQAERDIVNQGYTFTGEYFSENSRGTKEAREAAKAAAKKHRDAGFFARVIKVCSPGRIYTRCGYCVYKKSRK